VKLLKDMDEVELGNLMRGCAMGVERVAEHLGAEEPLFVLMLFNDVASSQYIANCNRPYAIEALRALADRLEKKETIERVEFPEPRLGYS
jgi:hypothetical protein